MHLLLSLNLVRKLKLLACSEYAKLSHVCFINLKNIKLDIHRKNPLNSLNKEFSSHILKAIRSDKNVSKKYNNHTILQAQINQSLCFFCACMCLCMCN